MENQKRETLATRLEKIKSLSQLKRLDESATKQAIVLPILQALGWDTSDIDEVYPEYSVEKKRVDYSLRLAGRNEFFLEIKKPEEDLGKHDEQLLDYSFRQGVKLAALSNGITWLFYLPMKECQWEARKFYAIDIIEQDIDNVVGKFVAILSREAVQTGEAKRLADAMFASALRKRTFDEKIPEAWNKLIAERDDQLKELLADRTEKLCGFKPGEAELLSFFELWKSRLIVPEPPTPSSEAYNGQKSWW